MTNEERTLVKYRMDRAKETIEEAKLLLKVVMSKLFNERKDR